MENLRRNIPENISEAIFFKEVAARLLLNSQYSIKKKRLRISGIPERLFERTFGEIPKIILGKFSFARKVFLKNSLCNFSQVPLEVFLTEILVVICFKEPGENFL